MGTFRELHISGDPFILANVWDKGSARMMAYMGAKALATSSAAHAFTQGVSDMGNVGRDEAIAHALELANATHLPLSADLENGYGDEPMHVALSIEMAANSELAGCCIEDVQPSNAMPYEFSKAVERIEAGVEAAANFRQKTGADFVLTARADGILVGQYGLDEAIKRLKAFEKAGADVLYAPMPENMDDLAMICNSLEKPVNALCAGPFARFALKDFANIGVARISLGSAMARVTHQAILDCGSAMFENGNFGLLEGAASGSKIDSMLLGGIETK
ncbi:MAG: isocitrate lyase/phosphoenolpyruvate mutase family protein [Devosiaceae bacterium]|nr:isocitrate lyase/phosphoenolpyruvate mutase family protein [Devosiaceae bacterium]